MPGGGYGLSFSADATREHTRVLDVVLAGNTTVADVHFTPVGSVAGSVTGATVAASVFVEGAQVSGSSSNGVYRLDDVPVGTWTIDALAPGFVLAAHAGVVVMRGQVTNAPTLALMADTTPAFPSAPLKGIALRLGRTDHAGTQVTVIAGTTELVTTTASDGSYGFSAVPIGVCALRFDYDGHTENIPQVLALGGTEGQVIDGGLYALSSYPLLLPEARRIAPLPSYRPLYPLDHDHLLYADIDPDGENVVLHELALTDGSSTTIADEVLDFFPYVTLSNDHQKLLYETDEGAELAVSAASGGPAVKLSGIIDDFNSAAFSPDGAHVNYPADDGTTYVVSSAGGASTSLWTGSAAFAFHPDGKRVVYQWCNGSDCRVSIRAIDGSDTPVDLLLDAQGVPKLTTNGAYVVLQTNSGPPQILAAATDGSGARTLWSGAAQSTVPLSADGHHVAILTGTELLVADLTSSATPAPVASNVWSAAFGTSRIVYTPSVVETAGGFYYPSLAQQPIDGGAEVVLGTQIAQYAVSPDGQYTVFIDQLDFAAGRGRLVGADATGATVVLASNVYGFVFTADSSRVLFSVDDPATPGGRLVQSAAPAGGAVATLASAVTSPGWDFSATLWLSPSGTSVAIPDSAQLVRAVATSGGTSQPVGVGTPLWIDDTRLVIEQTTLPPYSFQTGLYVWDVTP